MIENMAKRLSGILNKYKLPVALQVSINKTITDEICKLCAETADTVRMIDIWTLLEGMGFTNEQVEEFAQKAQENYSDAYGTYGLDAVFKLRQSNLNLSGASFCNGVAFVTVEGEIACNSSEICG